MATPVFKFRHPDLPGEDLYFIHNTFFELPETIPMDLSTFIWYHLKTGRTLEGFFTSWNNLNEFQTSLKDESFDNYFDENQKQQLYDDAIFGQSLKAAQENQKETVQLKEFIDFEKFKTDDISDYVHPSVNSDYLSGDFKLTFFYSHHYFMQYIWDNFNDKLDESGSYKFDREILLALIKINGLALSLASENLKKDRAVLLEAIKNDFRAFHFVDDSFKKDKTFILEAVKNNVSVFQILENRIQNDVDICFEKTKQECLIFFEKEVEDLVDINDLLFDNSHEVYEEDCNQETNDYYTNLSNKLDYGLICLEEAIKDGPFFCEIESFFSYELLKNNEDYILNLFKLWPHNLVDYNMFYLVASSRLQQSKKFIIELLKSELNSRVSQKSVLWNWGDFPTSYWSDKEFVKAAVKINGIQIKYASEFIKSNADIILEAVINNYNALQYASELLKSDKEFIKKIVNINGNALQYASSNIKSDKAIVSVALKRNCTAIQYASESLRSDKNIVLNAIKGNDNDTIVLKRFIGNGYLLQYVAESLKLDKEIVIESVKINGDALQYAHDIFRKDKVVVLEAVRNNGLALVFADESLKKDSKIVLEAIKNNGLALEFANESLKKDSKIVLEAFRNNTKSIKFLNDVLWCDKKFVLEAIKIHPLALQYASDSLKNDREIAVEAINKDGFALEYVSDSLKSDLDIVLQAIKIDYQAIQFADENLDIVQEAIAKNQEILLSFFKEQIEGIERYEYSARKNIEYDYDSIHEENPLYELDIEVRNILEDLLEFASEGYDYDNKYIIEGYCPFLYKYIKKDKDFILNIYQLWPHYLMQFNILYKLAPKDLLQTKGFLIEIFKLKVKGEQVWNWTHFPNHFWNDKEFVQLAINQDGIALQYANDIYKKDKGIVIEALKSSLSAIEFVDESLINDEDVLALLSEDLPF